MRAPTCPIGGLCVLSPPATTAPETSGHFSPLPLARTLAGHCCFGSSISPGRTPLQPPIQYSRKQTLALLLINHASEQTTTTATLARQEVRLMRQQHGLSGASKQERCPTSYGCGRQYNSSEDFEQQFY